MASSADEIFMEVPAVRDISKKFKQVSDFLKNVSKILDTLSNILKATAFIGAVGGAVVAQFIDMINPFIEQLSEKCGEISEDVSYAADAYERGDAAGASKFH